MKIKGLTVIFVITFLITFWINFIDFKLSTFWIFTNKASKVEAIIDNLCLSYIAGYIFYFINVYLVERQEKKYIMPYVSDRVKQIIYSNYSLIRILKQDSKLKNHYPDMIEFFELLSEQNLKRTRIQINNKEISFFEYLVTRQRITILNINKLLIASKHVDDELKSILYRLMESPMLNENVVLNVDDFDIKTFNKHKGKFTKYFDEIHTLEKYYDKNLPKNGLYTLRAPRINATNLTIL